LTSAARWEACSVQRACRETRATGGLWRSWYFAPSNLVAACSGAVWLHPLACARSGTRPRQPDPRAGTRCAGPAVWVAAHVPEACRTARGFRHALDAGAADEMHQLLARHGLDAGWKRALGMLTLSRPHRSPSRALCRVEREGGIACLLSWYQKDPGGVGRNSAAPSNGYLPTEAIPETRVWFIWIMRRNIVSCDCHGGACNSRQQRADATAGLSVDRGSLQREGA
jgi:hypothetical protein